MLLLWSCHFSGEVELCLLIITEAGAPISPALTNLVSKVLSIMSCQHFCQSVDVFLRSKAVEKAGIENYLKLLFWKSKPSLDLQSLFGLPEAFLSKVRPPVRKM